MYCFLMSTLLIVTTVTMYVDNTMTIATQLPSNEPGEKFDPMVEFLLYAVDKVDQNTPPLIQIDKGSRSRERSP